MLGTRAGSYSRCRKTFVTREVDIIPLIGSSERRRPPSLFSLLGPDRRTATPHGPATLEDGAPWRLRITRSTGAIGDRFVPGRQRLRRLHEHREAMQGSHITADAPRPALSAEPLARLSIEELQRRDLRGIERRLCAHRSLRRPPSRLSA